MDRPKLEQIQRVLVARRVSRPSLSLASRFSMHGLLQDTALAELASGVAPTQMMRPEGCERVIHPHPDDVSSTCESFVPTLSKGLEVVQTEMMSPRDPHPDDVESLVAERPYWDLDEPVGIRHGGYRIDPPDRMILYRPLPDRAYQAQMMRTKGCERLVPKKHQGQLLGAIDAQGSSRSSRVIGAQGSSRPSLSIDTEEDGFDVAGGMWAGGTRL